jgi:hypothetical protein
VHTAARAIGVEIAIGRRLATLTRPCTSTAHHRYIIDGRELREHRFIPVLRSSRAARLLDKDPRGFGGTVKQLYLSGPAGGAEAAARAARARRDHGNRPASDIASGGATPTFGRGARDAAG